MRKLMFLGLFPFLMSAQLFSVGVIGGVPFTDAVQSLQQGTTSTLYKNSNFTVGPALQIGLPLNLRIEVDALYRISSFALVTPFNSVSVDANQWRYPVLLQYRFQHLPVLKPFIEAGLAYERLSDVSAVAQAVVSGPGQLLQKSHGSLVVGAGVDAKVPFVRVSGELRYTRQGSSDFRDISNLNQAEFLVGIHF